MKVKVTVTEGHIRYGKPCNTNSCPIALALKEQLGLKEVDVDGDVVSFGVGEPNLSVKLPEKAVAFVEAFDSGEKVKPFSFTL